jgi:hypothetical protein
VAWMFKNCGIMVFNKVQNQRGRGHGDCPGSRGRGRAGAGRSI